MTRSTPSSVAAIPAKDAKESITEKFGAAVLMLTCFFSGNKKHIRKKASKK